MLIPILLFILSTSLFSTTDPIQIDTKIEKVTVFKQGAQVTRLGKVGIPKGKNVFKISNLPLILDTESLQLKGMGNFTILSVQQQNNTITTSVDSVVIQELNAINDTLKERIEEWNLQVQVLKEEEALILNNDKKIDKEKNKLSIEELRAMAIFYREQIGEIRLKKLQLQRKIKGYQKIINQNNQQLKLLKKAAKNIATKEVLVTVLAKQVTKGEIKLSYLVSAAGWTPTYDLRVKDVESPVNLIYKANVYQQSGEEWKEVKLTLSTASPNESGIKPTIQKWNLGFYNPYANEYRPQEKMKKRSMEEADLVLEEVVVTSSITGGRSTSPQAPSIPITTTMTQKATSVEFQFSKKNA